MAKELSNQEIVRRFGSKYGQDGIQAYGIGMHMGKKCIRVIIFRPKSDAIKLPETFLGIKIVPILVDGESRVL